jgi:CheY-like chemotaxis protein
MQIINDILDFSQLSSGRMTIKKECFRPKEILDISIATLEQRFKAKKQKYYCKITETVPELIITDKSKCIQMLINLLSNAHKYTEIGGKIEINLFCEENILCVQVKDNGVGISSKDHKRIFEAFERINCKDQVCSGTGLGLAVSKKLARLLGGDINLLSTPNVGSIFTITVEYDNYVENYSISKNDLHVLEDQVILIVDDNADNRIFISELIFTWKMRPIVCASALEALRLVLGNRYNFNLAIIDICMPGTTGPELAKQIKEERPLLPLIALSSLDYYVNTKDFEHVLSKPINKSELFNAISTSLITNPTVFLERKSTLESATNKIDYGKKILIIEDVQYNRELLTCMLKNLKYQNVTISENGLDAWTKIISAQKAKNPYEILLLDLKMPKVNGFEIIERIKKQNWNLPKIIVVTASIMDKDRRKCKRLGAKYFLNKPIDMKQLKQVMLYVSALI